MAITFIRKTAGSGEGLRLHTEPLPYLTSPLLEEIPSVQHLFTTREGGVSEGILRSMNLSFSRGDQPENVMENFRRIAAVFGRTPDRIVSTDQTHTANIRVVTEADAGKGVVRERDYTDIDGLVTDVPGLILGVYIADCVPVLLTDRKGRAVAAVHSGWRGTAAGIGAAAVRLLGDKYGILPEDLCCAIGPSICKDCYEVSFDVAEAISGILGKRAGEAVFPRETSADGSGPAEKEKQKYLADLWQSNRIILENAGVKPENISVTDICTACNQELLFSHRASRGKRGNLGAFIMLR